MSDLIFLKYSREPGFPFDDWVDKIESVHALISFWSEVFKAEVTDTESHFGAMNNPQQDPERPVFAVISNDGCKAFQVRHLSRADAKNSGFFVTGRLDTYLDPIPNSFTLDVHTDLSEDRIRVIRALLRQQMNGNHRSLSERDEELDTVIIAYPDLFPDMVRTTRVYRKSNLDSPEE